MIPLRSWKKHIVIRNAEYEHLSGKYELHRLLDEGLSAMKAGQSKPAADAFAELEKRLGIG
jgi:hypothetical protein